MTYESIEISICFDEGEKQYFAALPDGETFNLNATNSRAAEEEVKSQYPGVVLSFA